jgi:hypothetical protein
LEHRGCLIDKGPVVSDPALGQNAQGNSHRSLAGVHIGKESATSLMARNKAIL